MPPKKQSKKKKMNFMKSVFNSSLLLFIVFVVALMDLICLWKIEDNESLFLFLLIAFITRTQTENMIMVLAFPLIVVNVLVFLRTKFQSQEGFVSNDEYEPYDFQEWLKEYVQDETNSSKGLTYKDMTTQMNSYGNLFELIDVLLQGASQMQDSDDAENRKYVDNVKDYLILVYNLSERDPLYNTDDAKYVRKLGDDYNLFLIEKETQKRKKKVETEDDDDDNDDEDEDEDKDEDDDDDDDDDDTNVTTTKVPKKKNTENIEKQMDVLKETIQSINLEGLTGGMKKKKKKKKS
jgi:hypothetical protein